MTPFSAEPSKDNASAPRWWSWRGGWTTDRSEAATREALGVWLRWRLQGGALLSQAKERLRAEERRRAPWLRTQDRNGAAWAGAVALAWMALMLCVLGQVDPPGGAAWGPARWALGVARDALSAGGWLRLAALAVWAGSAVLALAGCGGMARLLDVLAGKKRKQRERLFSLRAEQVHIGLFPAGGPRREAKSLVQARREAARAMGVSEAELMRFFVSAKAPKGSFQRFFLKARRALWRGQQRAAVFFSISMILSVSLIMPPVGAMVLRAVFANAQGWLLLCSRRKDLLAEKAAARARRALQAEAKKRGWTGERVELGLAATQKMKEASARYAEREGAVSRHRLAALLAKRDADARVEALDAAWRERRLAMRLQTLASAAALCVAAVGLGLWAACAPPAAGAGFGAVFLALWRESMAVGVIVVGAVLACEAGVALAHGKAACAWAVCWASVVALFVEDRAEWAHKARERRPAAAEASARRWEAFEIELAAAAGRASLAKGGRNAERTSAPAQPSAMAAAVSGDELMPVARPRRL
jgi:hypothetical protein